MIATGFQFIDIKREECESFQDYMERCYFIINNLRMGNHTLEYLTDKSLVFRSMKILNCKYNSQISNEINDLCFTASIKI